MTPDREPHGRSLQENTAVVSVIDSVNTPFGEAEGTVMGKRLI